MLQKNPVVLSHINEKVVDFFKDSTTFYPDSFRVDFIFSGFDSDKTRINPYIYSFKDLAPSNDLFWKGNLNKFNSYDEVYFLYLSNKPSYLIKFADQNISKINWGISLFLSTSFSYNISLLKSLIQKFPNAKIFDVFPKGQTFMLNRAVTELSLLKDDYSISSSSDYYIIRNLSEDCTFKFFNKDFNITQLQRQFKYRIPCAHRYITL